MPEPDPVPEPEPLFVGRFSDDDGNSHEGNIEKIAELGITLGCNPPDNDRYCPWDDVERAQMMAFLARALGEEGDTSATTSRFSDVPDDAWYLGYLERLADLGVVEPDEDGRFRPYEPLRRVEMAVLLSRAFPHISPVAPVGVFGDVAVDAPFAAEIEGILAAGITSGCSADPLLYCPNDPVPRAQMASFLARALRGPPDDDAGVVPGEGVRVRMARATWSTGYFQAALYRALLEELGYAVSDPAELELGPSQAYQEMAEGRADFWVNSWYPFHDRDLAERLADGSLVGEHLTPVGEQMIAGGLQGFLITKSFAEEFGIRTLDDLNGNPVAIAAFDAGDPDPGNGVADIFGCPTSWPCGDIIDSQIALSGWENIAQVSAGYDAMLAEAVFRADRGEPMVAFTWTPSGYFAAFRPGGNVVWLGMDRVLDDSNPLGREGGESWDQRPGTARIGPDKCPDAGERGTCQLGWVAADILVTARNEFLEENPAAATLFEVVTLDVVDISQQILAHNTGADPADLAARWITRNRDQVDAWLAQARAAA